MSSASESSLLLVSGRAAGVRYAIDRDELVIGRASSSGIQISDEEVSRRHAVLRRKGNRVSIEDLGSQNGVLVNGGKRAGEVFLRPGDAVTIGSYVFLFDPPVDLLVGEGGRVFVADDVPEGSGSLVAMGVTGTETSQEGPYEALIQILGRVVGSGDSAAQGEPSDVITEALKIVVRRFGAERGLVLAAEPAKKRAPLLPRVLAAVGEGTITVSRTVVGRILDEKRAIVSGDAATDVAFAGGVSLASAEIRSLLAAPLIVDGRTIGLVHLDRRSRDAFDRGQLETLVPLANMLALVVVGKLGLERMRQRERESRHRVEAPVIVSSARPMADLCDRARRAARASSSVLIQGETGTGKELIARLLHVESDRRQGPFVAVNCGALVPGLEESELFGHEKGAFTGAQERKEGLFEVASTGTLFLDEVSECAPALQVKLLRAIQERVIFRLGGTVPIPVDVRVVSASSRRLKDEVARGSMREDLYYRLAVIELDVPPLRARKEDIGPLARHFAKVLCREAGVAPKTLTADALEALALRSWPGNVRELRNAVERLIILSEGSELGAADLPTELLLGAEELERSARNGESLGEVIARVEREMILRVMVRTGGVKTAAAEALGISRVTLDAKLRTYGIDWKKAAD